MKGNKVALGDFNLETAILIMLNFLSSQNFINLIKIIHALKEMVVAST